MRFDYKAYHIHCRARHDEDGQFYPHVTITRGTDEASAHGETHHSGELHAFESEADALHCARVWAIEWCDEAAA